MKLVVFTPASKRSAIGRMAALVVDALVSDHHEVVVVRSEEETLLKEGVHPFRARIIQWNDHSEVGRLLTEWTDAVAYHIGDFYGYHKGCLEWLPRYPGIICLHDYFLGNLFYGWAKHRRDKAKRILEAWYGDDAANEFFVHSNGEAFIEGTRHASPMAEWVCSMGKGVITHSSWGINRVLTSCPGPVAVLPLAYAVTEEEDPIARPSDEADLPFRVLTVGHVNANKRAESIIRAIGSSPVLRKVAEYHLVGAIEPERSNRLAALAHEMHVRIVIAGEVSDADLRKALAEAAVVSCLRWPALEAASASAIEAMLHGRPIIVTDTGFYREIPDEHAVKINPHSEIDDLRAALERLYHDPSLRAAMGYSARKWARETFSPDNYGRTLVEIAGLATKTDQAIAMVNHFASVLENWRASPPMYVLAETIAPLEIFSRTHARDARIHSQAE